MTTTLSRLFSGTFHTTGNTRLTILQILFSTFKESQYNEMAATMLELDEIGLSELSLASPATSGLSSVTQNKDKSRLGRSTAHQRLMSAPTMTHGTEAWCGAPIKVNGKSVVNTVLAFVRPDTLSGPLILL